MDSKDTAQTLLQYENDFFNYGFCSSLENLKQRFADDFIECGVSGIHTREDVINSLNAITEDRAISIHGFECTLLSNTVALVTYKAHFQTSGRESFHSSIWINEGGSWKIRYHQATLSAFSKSMTACS